MKHAFSCSLFRDKISHSGVFGVTEYESTIKILIILDFQGQFQNGGLFFSEKYKCCYRNKYSWVFEVAYYKFAIEIFIFETRNDKRKMENLKLLCKKIN